MANPIQWYVSFGTPLFNVHLCARDTNFGPGNMLSWSLYLLPLLKGHLYLGERDTFCGFQKLGFNLHSGDNLALKKWLATYVIDEFKGLFTWRRGTPGRWGNPLWWVTHLSTWSLILIWSRLHDRWGDPPHVTSPIWGPPPPCKQALSVCWSQN